MQLFGGGGGGAHEWALCVRIPCAGYDSRVFRTYRLSLCGSLRPSSLVTSLNGFRVAAEAGTRQCKNFY